MIEQRLGNVDETEMFRTFNMGIGVVVVVAEQDAEQVNAAITDCVRKGTTAAGNREVRIR